MKGGPLDRTKVVLRHLPPSIPKSNLVEQIDSRFAGRYSWFSFYPGKNSQKHLKYSRAYIDFKKPEDVIEFAEFLNGHVFVNEKGTQFKAIVEYSPSQNVPEQWSTKKDGREGTLLKDPDYLEFLEFIAKPVENLPSAEIQLERKEAERAGAPKGVAIVTPLMDYVRQKRAAKGRVPRILTNGKPGRKAGVISSRNSVSGSSKRGSEKRRTSNTMYVLKDSSKTVKEEKAADTSVNSAIALGKEASEGGIGSGPTVSGKILLLKGRQKEIPNVSGDSSLLQNAATPPKPSHDDTLPKQNQRHEGSERITKSIVFNKDTRQDHQSSVSQLEPRNFTLNHIRDKRPPRPPGAQLSQKDSKDSSEDKMPGNNFNAKQERRTRNKDRPDRGVWTALRRSDGSHASNESLSSSGSQTSQIVDSAEETKEDIPANRGSSSEHRPVGSGRGTHYLGSYRHGGRRALAYNSKDADRSVVDGRTSKRVSSGHGSQEKQVWVQKSSSPP